MIQINSVCWKNKFFFFFLHWVYKNRSLLPDGSRTNEFPAGWGCCSSNNAHNKPHCIAATQLLTIAPDIKCRSRHHFRFGECNEFFQMEEGKKTKLFIFVLNFFLNHPVTTVHVFCSWFFYGRHWYNWRHLCKVSKS